MSDSITKNIKNNLWLKVGLIGFISILLMIPMAHINSIREISESCGLLKSLA